MYNILFCLFILFFSKIVIITGLDDMDNIIELSNSRECSLFVRMHRT